MDMAQHRNQWTNCSSSSSKYAQRDKAYFADLRFYLLTSVKENMKTKMAWADDVVRI